MANESFLNTFADALEAWEAKLVSCGREVPKSGELCYNFAGRRYRAEYKVGHKPKIFEISLYGRYVATGLPTERRVF